MFLNVFKKSKWNRRAFAGAMFSMVILWFLTTYSTKSAPGADGSVIYGFPLPFYRWGGFCGDGICESFSSIFLLMDIVLLFAIPLIVSMLWAGFSGLVKKLLILTALGLMAAPWFTYMDAVLLASNIIWVLFMMFAGIKILWLKRRKNSSKTKG